MLRVKSNVNNCKRGYKDLQARIISTGDTYGNKIVIYSESHGLLSNDVVSFKRQDGETISFYEDISVEDVIDNNTFTINGFYERLLSFDSYEVVEIRNPLNRTHTKRKYLKLTFSEDYKHILTTNKDDITISGTYTYNNDLGNYEYNGKVNLCDGDYVLYDNVYLRMWDANNEMFSDILNLSNFKLKGVLNDGTIFNFNNCIVGVNLLGNDDRLTLYIPFLTNSSYFNSYDEYITMTSFLCDDVRFLHDSVKIMDNGMYFQPGAALYKETGDIEVDLGVGFDFATNMYQEELLSNYATNVANGEINGVIDYEKHQYHPMYYSNKVDTIETLEGGQKRNITIDEFFQKNLKSLDENLKPIRKINFKLNLRQKNYIEDGDVIDYGSWSTDDSKYWNNYGLTSSGDNLSKIYKNIDADLLGDLGFTDEDVYYQKDALKKSFIRLSFYDNPNRENQKLLFYSTVYFDTNVLSSNYMKDLSIIRENQGTERSDDFKIVYLNNIKYPLISEMFCTDKFDDTSSSDGFYIHLYDKMVSGNTYNTIYLKIEFNNAKFGKTVPLIMPVNEKTNEPISPTSSSFPRDYIKTGGIDMNRLMKDMYIKIYIKYDFKLGRYVWFLPKEGDGDELTFNLFEPRLNGYDTMSYYKMQGGDISYGTEDGLPSWFGGEDEGSFIIDIDGNVVWLDENGDIENDSVYTKDCCCLYTTAVTLDTSELVDGTKLFNEKSKSVISSIWIDGIKVSKNYFDENGNIKTNKLQLPDNGFSVNIDGEKATWMPTTTTDGWSDRDNDFISGVKKNAIKIHSVNYYFKENKSDSTDLLNELYLGINGNTKTVETTEYITNLIKSSVYNLSNGELLPIGMFSNISSIIRCKFVEKTSGYYFTTVGNSAFNNCKKLEKIDVEGNSPCIISKNCFCGCRALKYANIGNSVAILRQAFQGDYTLSVIKFDLDNQKTKYIGCGSFGYTKVNNVTIPSTVVRIGNSAFRRCYKLKDFKIHNDNFSELINVGKRVFYDNAIMRYCLDKVFTSKKVLNYVYNGEINDFVLSLSDEGIKSVFYSKAKSNEISNYIVGINTNILQHFLDGEYIEYLVSKQGHISDFDAWYNFYYKKNKK